MSQDEGLVRAIQSHPEEHTPRLACADWFEEQGEPDRAEFIRVQIELARLSLWDRHRRDLVRREYELYAKHANRWSAPLLGRVRRWQFRRGFVEQVKSAASEVARHAEMLWQLFPVREVLLKYLEPADVGKVARAPWLGRVEVLDLTHSHHLGDEGLRRLLASPHVGRLRGLVLQFCGLSAHGLAQLARADLPALERLDLSANPAAGAEGVAAFLADFRLPRAADVRWGFDGWSADVCAALAASPLMPRIKVLEHFGHNTPNEAVFGLLAGGRWDGLEELDLCRRSCTTEQARGLAANHSLARLRVLNLSGGPIGDEGLTALVRSPIAQNLRELRVRNCGITWRGVREMIRSPGLAYLEFLDLSENAIGDGGCKVLAGSGLANLRGLGLSGCGLSTRSARALVGLEGHIGYLDILKNGGLGPRARSDLERRFGERLERDPDDRDWTDWHVAQATAHPPRCLSDFAVRTDTPLTRRVWQEQIHSDPEYAVFELGHPTDPAQRPTVLGYWLQPNTERVFLSPLAVRWKPSGAVSELFDGEQHGYGGEHGGSCEVTGVGPRAQWKCPHQGCRDHTLLVAFRYRDWGAERPLHRYFPPQEQFEMFYLGAYCHGRDDFTCILNAECR